MTNIQIDKKANQKTDFIKFSQVTHQCATMNEHKDHKYDKLPVLSYKDNNKAAIIYNDIYLKPAYIVSIEKTDVKMVDQYDYRTDFCYSPGQGTGKYTYIPNGIIVNKTIYKITDVNNKTYIIIDNGDVDNIEKLIN